MKRLTAFFSLPVFQKVFAVLMISVTILFCTIPMGWSPLWNGETPHHRNQYEKMTQALLEGRLFLEEADPELALLTNPYDPVESVTVGIIPITMGNTICILGLFPLCYFFFHTKFSQELHWHLTMPHKFLRL